MNKREQNLVNLKYDFLESDFFIKKNIKYNSFNLDILDGEKKKKYIKYILSIFFVIILGVGFVVEYSNLYLNLLLFLGIFVLIGLLIRYFFLIANSILNKWKGFGILIFSLFVVPLFFFCFVYYSFGIDLYSFIGFSVAYMQFYLIFLLLLLYLIDGLGKIILNYKFIFWETINSLNILFKVLFWNNFKYESNDILKEITKGKTIYKKDLNGIIIKKVDKIKLPSILLSLFIVFNLITGYSVLDIVSPGIDYIKGINLYFTDLIEINKSFNGIYFILLMLFYSLLFIPIVLFVKIISLSFEIKFYSLLLDYKSKK